ncbi:putative rRNA methylase, S-adenosyl-L-methionine-dependent methyltransferase [Rosa chinensis]|uniref:Putative rRNA methylase, S-adenosyl-L-methionine-dependent methyltransferase n=2 Tax=Rosa chinensis TaxID=74649 RepID=A0A2P6PR69_ROSCH|nr:putative rRNA methylase YtqB isoform X1 [Rosa chinensis]PRQ24414.1 putative rRNA methylase, S-adenosyl-L-methionine-dependent methyltransferase [Rosa chinensis]
MLAVVPRRLSWGLPHLLSTQKQKPPTFRNFSGNSAGNGWLGKFELNAATSNDLVSVSVPKHSPLSGLEDLLLSFISGKKKATEVAHSVWKRVVQKGDTVIDATCGNGHDTLAMLKMVADESGKGSVYGMDIQEVALQKTSSLLEESVSPKEKELVKLFSKCHSKMREVLLQDTCVRLVAFNLGYLPGGDKTIITESGTTLKALEVAKDILLPGGLISLVVYVGHPGGWEELQMVQHFVSKLSVEKWICCEYQSSNRSWSPVLVFLFKRC